MAEPLTEEELDDLARELPGLNGLCGHCQRTVSNRDDHDHRVTPILRGGRGVECKLRGDYA